MVKNDLFDRYCRLIISALERFEKKPIIWIDAELNRLQNDRKSFFGNRLFTYRYSQNTENLDIGKNEVVQSISIFSTLFLRQMRRSYIQFCRASKDLSIGI